MNEISDFIIGLKKEVDLSDLFSHRILNRFEGVKYYFDETEYRGHEKFIYLLDTITKIIDESCGQRLFVCIDALANEQQSNITVEHRKIIQAFNYFGLEHDQFKHQEITGEDVNENKFFLFFSPLNRRQLKLLVLARLCNYFSFMESRFLNKIFIICPENKVIYHIYDDRGMDVINWTLPKPLDQNEDE